MEECTPEYASSTTDIIADHQRSAIRYFPPFAAACVGLARSVQSLEPNAKGQQDYATNAWNFCTALNYKANETVPWKLVTNINRPSIRFAGIGFYRSRDREALHTSLAQVFDDLGNGVVLRGTPAELSRDKDDRRPHQSDEQAYTLLKRALVEADGGAPNDRTRSDRLRIVKPLNSFPGDAADCNEQQDSVYQSGQNRRAAEAIVKNL